MAMKYLGTDGLSHLIEQIKAKFAPITHTHKVADVSDFSTEVEKAITAKNFKTDEDIQSMLAPYAKTADLTAITTAEIDEMLSPSD